MTGRKKRGRQAVTFFLSGLMCLSTLWGGQAEAREVRCLVPVGHTVGIKLFSDGIVVIGLAEVESTVGRTAPGAACGLQVGDVIEEANGTAVESSEQFARLIQCGGTVELEICRSGEELSLEAEPVQGEDGIYRLGAWVRDSMAGIGTVTFYDPETGMFGALGHGVTDGDTGLLMPLGDGSVMASTVKAVKRGSAGEPGELKGKFDLTKDMGQLYANTELGVFGILSSGSLSAGEAIPVASAEQVKVGAAVIRSNVSGDAVEEYDIEILRILEREGTQNLLISVTDENLIQKTGGIVQGMSGSPIIQNGRLVGAVTHVMIDNPRRGYGILIENMLEAAE